jgi:hypothetical protein
MDDKQTIARLVEALLPFADAANDGHVRHADNRANIKVEVSFLQSNTAVIFTYHGRAGCLLTVSDIRHAYDTLHDLGLWPLVDVEESDDE